MSVHRIVLAAFAASAIALPSWAQGKAAKPAKTADPDADAAARKSCVEAMVNVGVNSMQAKYWPQAQADDTKRQAYTAQAMAVLNSDKQLNRELNRFCGRLQVAAKKVAGKK